MPSNKRIAERAYNPHNVVSGDELRMRYADLGTKDRRVIDEMIEQLSANINGMGEMTASEVIYCIFRAGCWP